MNRVSEDGVAQKNKRRVLVMDTISRCYDGHDNIDG